MLNIFNKLDLSGDKNEKYSGIPIIGKNRFDGNLQQENSIGLFLVLYWLIGCFSFPWIQ